MTALRKTTVAVTRNAAPFAIRAERASDVVAREALLDACFGANRHLRTCQRLRDGRAPAEGLSLSAVARGRARRRLGDDRADRRAGAEDQGFAREGVAARSRGLTAPPCKRAFRHQPTPRVPVSAASSPRSS